MKNLLSEYDVNEKLLTNKERQEIDAMHDTLKEMLEIKIRFMWDELLQREEVVMERIAQHVGFDGYDTGAFNYREQYQKLILKEDLDEQVKQKLMEFSTCKMKDDEYIKLAVDVEELKKYEAGQRQWLKQQYLNRILTATRQRMEKYQSDGKPFMPVKAYNALPVGEKEKLRRAVSQTIKLDDGSRILLDKMIAGRICRLWVAGITTGASCSGMVIDHPYHRHEEDDRFGRWKAGENCLLKSEAGSAYISLPLEGNHRELLEQAEEKAVEWGWTVERGNVYGKDSLILRPQHTLDGLSYLQVCDEVNAVEEDVCRQCGLKDRMEARYEALKIVEYDHGGRIHYTDRMLTERWDKLTEKLLAIKDAIDRKTLQKNIKEGKAVKLYWYDSAKVRLSPEQLAGVFQRSGILLDKDSVTKPMENGESKFLVKDGTAYMMKEQEPLPDKTLTESVHSLSYLMASQFKQTAYTAEPEPYKFTVTAMIHPDPQTVGQAERFTLTKDITEHEYYNSFNENSDWTQFLANKFKEDLYTAAMDAYEHGLREKVDDNRDRQAVSDIRIRKGIDGNTYISCHIYGQKQIAKRMSVTDVEYYRMRMTASDKAYNGVAPELAHKYFEKELAQEQERSMRRNR